eukprot:5964893-Amphidinium_carterae.1
MQERATRLALRLKELWTWIAKQEALLAQQSCRDCDEITRVETERRVLPFSAPVSQGAGMHRRKRAFWHPLEWMVLLAQQVQALRVPSAG